MNKHVYSVKRLVGEIRSLLESSYPEIWVEGEISNLAKPASGHLYFALKDDSALIRCVLFKQRRRQFATAPADGMQVLLRGRIAMYEPRGDLQLMVSHLEDAGEGALRREFEQLKRKLAAEGLFDARHKQPLPAYPGVVGVISSASGAVLHDIRVTLKRRYPVARLIVYPALVQGAGAADSIIDMLRVANHRREADLLILARGGGSLEDLQAFNHEGVARAVFASELPVVSAIGHEIDFTITDMVADVRAPTPTAAAESVSPELAQLRETIAHAGGALYNATRRIMDSVRQNLDYTSARLVHPVHQLQLAGQSRRALTSRLGYLVNNCLDKHRWRIQQQVSGLRYRSPRAMLAQNLQNLAAAHKRLGNAATASFTNAAQTTGHLANKLRLMSPAHILDRGYAILQDQNHDVVFDAGKTRKGQVLTASVSRGKFRCVVDRLLEE